MGKVSLTHFSHLSSLNADENNYRTLGNLLIVRKQRIQMLTVFGFPSTSIRRRCTLSTKRRRVRCCEKGTLFPYIGLRSQTSQRPAAISIYPSLLDSHRGLWYTASVKFVRRSGKPNTFCEYNPFGLIWQERKTFAYAESTCYATAP